MNHRARFFLSSLLGLVVIFSATRPAAGQTQPHIVPPVAERLRSLANIPSVSGYEKPVADHIRAELASSHLITDTLGDVTVTIGSGTPNRLIVTPIDEP